MKFITSFFLVNILVSCSSAPMNLREEVQELYSKADQRICPDMIKEASSRKEAAYCLGWIYINETDKKLPAVDQLAFRDIAPGEPSIPYLWVVVSNGLMQPDSSHLFGVNRQITQQEWGDALNKMDDLIDSWEKTNPKLRLR